MKIVVAGSHGLIGTALLAASTLVTHLRPPPGEQPTPVQMAVLYACLYLIALGTGGLKSSVSGFEVSARAGGSAGISPAGTTWTSPGNAATRSCARCRTSWACSPPT